MVKPVFKKGQEVVVLGRWNDAALFYAMPMFVYSAGKKQMVLVDANGVKFAGANFVPAERQHNEFHWVKPAMPMEEALEQARAMAVEWKAYKMAHYERCLKANGGEAYDRAIRKDMAELEAAVPAALPHAELLAIVKARYAA
jgi:hypothetical protein